MKRIISLSTLLLCCLLGAHQVLPKEPENAQSTVINQSSKYFESSTAGATIVINDIKPSIMQQQNPTHNMISHMLHWPKFPEIWTPDMDSLQTNLRRYSNSAQTWCRANKWRLLAGSTLTLYGYLLHQISSCTAALQDNAAWCNWKQAVSLAQIVTTPQADLIHALKMDIFKKYHLSSINKSEPQDVYDMFMTSTAQEEQILQWYETLQKGIKKYRLSRFFSFQIEPQALEEKKARLAFVSELFSSWYVTQHM